MSAKSRNVAGEDHAQRPGLIDRAQHVGANPVSSRSRSSLGHFPRPVAGAATALGEHNEGQGADRQDHAGAVRLRRHGVNQGRGVGCGISARRSDDRVRRA